MQTFDQKFYGIRYTEFSSEHLQIYALKLENQTCSLIQNICLNVPQKYACKMPHEMSAETCKNRLKLLQNAIWHMYKNRRLSLHNACMQKALRNICWIMHTQLSAKAKTSKYLKMMHATFCPHLLRNYASRISYRISIKCMRTFGNVVKLSVHDFGQNR